jgi:hypothetical protein
MSKKEFEEEKAGLPAASKRIIWAAGLFSAIWLLGAVIIAWSFHCGLHAPVKINEWGDYAAGVSAPIAFVWLVVAVLLQSTELREQRKELVLTREEFAHNREVMKAQAEEARRQAEFIQKQTEILTENHASTAAEDIFNAAVDLVATRLVQYRNGWLINATDSSGDGREVANPVVNLRTQTYNEADSKLVIAKTTQTLRTQLRQVRKSYSAFSLHVQHPHDFRRMYTAIVSASFRIGELPESFKIKASTLELGELRKQVEHIAQLTGQKPFMDVTLDSISDEDE